MLGTDVQFSELYDGLEEDYSFYPLVRGTTLNSTRLYMLVLYGLIRSNGFKDLVEIGVMKGITSSFLARAAKLNGGKLTCYDVSGENIANALANLERHGLSEQVQFWCMRSQDAKPAPCDFVFIDGDHSYEGVSGDFAVFAPALRLGGVLAFHDTRDERIERFLKYGIDIPAQWEHINFLGDCGLALYRRVR